MIIYDVFVLERNLLILWEILNHYILLCIKYNQNNNTNDCGSKERMEIYMPLLHFPFNASLGY